MATQNPKQTKKTKKKKPRLSYEYDDFIEWIALPNKLRKPKTQRELARKFGIGEDTLSDWKQREGFWEEVEKKRKSWGKERTPNVLLGLYKKASETGDPRAVRLWFEVVEDKKFNDRTPATCPHCVNYADDPTTDEELERRIIEQKKFFTKQS